MRRIVLSIAMVALLTPVAGTAQESETLADIRQELSILYVELQRLKRELSTTGATGDVTVGGSALERINAIEAELVRLTSKTEELEFRIDRVVTDGTNRVGDLEFRLCELEAHCDIGTLETGSTLGGGAAPAVTGDGGTGGLNQTGDAGSGDQGSDGPQLAVAEEADFKAAEAALEAGNFADAAAKFAAFQTAYPGGPLTDLAGLLRGEALEEGGNLKEAGRAYLDVFSSNETGPVAPEALFQVGDVLGELGQKDQACVTLGEVGVRFPGNEAAVQARDKMAQLGCT